ncbi:MAG: beta-propeller domain-containing protein [Sulfolobales archaeon]
MSRTTFIGLVILAVVLGASLSTLPHFLVRTRAPTTKQLAVVESPKEYVEARLEGLKTFSSYLELFNYLNNLVKLRQVAADISSGYYTLAVRLGLRTPVEVAAAGPTPKAAPVATSTTDTRVSRTNVQVESVDEPDMVKTDGRIITVAVGSTVFIVDAKEKKLLSRFEANSSVVGMFLVEGKLIVISVGTVLRDYVSLLTQAKPLPLSAPAGTPNTTIYVVDVSNAANPEVVLKVSATGSFLSARYTDSSIYVLTTLPLETSNVPFVNSLPLSPSSIAVIDEEPDTYTTIVTIDVARLNYTAYSFLTGPGSWVYMSPTRLYVGISKYITTTTMYKTFLSSLVKYLPQDTASRIRDLLSAGNIAEALEVAHKYLNSISDEDFDVLISQVNSELGSLKFNEETLFHAFGLSGLSIKYLGSFKVDGVVLDQFSMEEMGNYFVVATTVTPSSLRVYTYRMVQEPSGKPITIVEYVDDRAVSTKTYTPIAKLTKTPPRLYYVTLVSVDEPVNNVFVIDLENFGVLGSLRGLARGERIYSARLVKNVLFLVTFRQVDPLFAIDLSNPEEPVVLGYLKIPGFSEYLHPVSSDRLLGVGLEDNNLKISLFDVSNPTEMRELSKVHIECSWSPVLSDHKAITVDVDFAVVYLPVWSYCYYPPLSGLAVVEYGEHNLRFLSLLEVEGVFRAVYIGEELYAVSPDRIVVYSIPDLNYVTEVLLR